VVLFITTGLAYNTPVLSVTFTVASQLDPEDEEEEQDSGNEQEGDNDGSNDDDGNESPCDDCRDGEEENDEEGVHSFDLQAIPAMRYQWKPKEFH
jgi:hypothetical protein